MAEYSSQIQTSKENTVLFLVSLCVMNALGEQYKRRRSAHVICKQILKKFLPYDFLQLVCPHFLSPWL
jgi:hypothetical protein